MPWLTHVPAVIEAWYPGARGGEAIASVLSGRINPSGHLPITFPASEAQLPRPIPTDPDGTTSNPGEATKGVPFQVDYNVEGADVGYKWFIRKQETPLFPFGDGLSYTHFTTTRLRAAAKGRSLDIGFDIANAGHRDGIATPQIYIDGAHFVRRLVGFTRVALKPGKKHHVTLRVDPRLLAHFDTAAKGWRIDADRLIVAVRPDAMADGPSVPVTMIPQTWPVTANVRISDGGALP